MEKDGSLAQVSLNLVECVEQEVRRGEWCWGVWSTLTQPLPAAMSWPTRWWWGYWGLMESTPELVWNRPAASSTSSVLTTTVCLSLPWSPSLSLMDASHCSLTAAFFPPQTQGKSCNMVKLHINVTFFFKYNTVQHFASENFGNIDFLVTYVNNASGCIPAY